MVVLNPTAGRGQGQRRRLELEPLLMVAVERYNSKNINEPASLTWEIIETTAALRATELAGRASAEGAAIVAAAGGDGTLNEVANGIVGTEAMLGILPLGTGNDFARDLGLGTDLSAAVEALCFGTPRPIDLGKCNGRWFLNIAGCGFDAVVAQRVNQGFRFLHGTAAYLAAVAQSLIGLKAAEMRLTLDDDTIDVRALMCSVCNTTCYGGGMKIAPDAKIDDGWFDICIIGEAGRWEFLRTFPHVFKGTHTTHPKVRIVRARNVTIESSTALPLLIDGEVLGTTPVIFTLFPHALRIMAPRPANSHPNSSPEDSGEGELVDGASVRPTH